MTLPDFAAFVFLIFGVLLPRDAVLDQAVTDIRFVRPDELVYPDACAETELLRWTGPDGTETRRVKQIRVLWPGMRALCPAGALRAVVSHELACHARIFLLEGDTGASHARPGCEPRIYVTP